MKPTTTQIERWYNRLYYRVTRGDGYQPFGYDIPTLEATHPGFKAAHNRLARLWKEAMAREEAA